MLDAQSEPLGFLTSTAWPSAIGDANCKYIEFSIRRSYISNGAYIGRRLNPTPVTAIVCPLAVTVNAPGDGVAKLPLLSTKFHCVTCAGSGCFVLMSFNSSTLGVRTCRPFEPTCGSARLM